MVCSLTELHLVQEKKIWETIKLSHEPKMNQMMKIAVAAVLLEIKTLIEIQDLKGRLWLKKWKLIEVNLIWTLVTKKTIIPVMNLNLNPTASCPAFQDDTSFI